MDYKRMMYLSESRGCGPHSDIIDMYYADTDEDNPPDCCDAFQQFADSCEYDSEEDCDF